MANNQITPFQLTDQFTMDNFNQRINETNIALQNKASIATQQTVEATSVGARRALYPTADNLQATINALPRLLTEAIEIYVSGTITDVIQLSNFYGSGNIIIRARNVGDAIFKKNLIVSNCTVRIRLINLVFEDNADAITVPIYNGLLDVDLCRSVSVESCTFTGTSNKNHNGVVVLTNSQCEINTCTITNCKDACYVVGSSIVQLLNTTASGNGRGINIYLGGIVILTGSTENTVGGSSNSVTGGLIVRNNAFVQ